MTTQTNVDRSNKAIQAPTQINHLILWIFVVALLVTAVITAVYLVNSPGERAIAPNNRVMEAQAARYQGWADLFTKKEIGLERGWLASAARYQGLANLEASAKERAVQVSAARYQGLADLYALSKLSLAFRAEAARYQGLADKYTADKTALERGWEASAARYQGLAIYFDENGK